MDVKPLMRKYKKTIASDGYNKTFHDRVVGYRFLRYYQQDNGRFDSISFTLRNSDSTFIKEYKRQLKEEKKVKDSTKTDSLPKPKKKLTKAEKKAKKLEWKKKFERRQKYSYDYSTKEYNRNLTFIGKDSTIPLLTIKGFSRGKKKAYQAFYEEVFTKIDSANSHHLIIDLRNTFGGRLNEIMELYSYLTDKDFELINPSEVNSRIPTMKVLMSNSRSLGQKLFSGLLASGIIV